MFILSNNKQIDYEAIIDAMLDLVVDHIYWLDAQTGMCNLESWFIKNSGKVNFESGKNNRFFRVPKIAEFERWQWIAGYIAEMVECENKEFAKKLEEIKLGKNPYYDFIKILEEKENEGWIYGWNSWEGDSAFEEMKKWFIKLPLEIEEKMDHFDDCPICKAMEEGRTSEKELKDAFREANFKNVLDDIYDKDK